MQNSRTVLDKISDGRILNAVMDAMDEFPERLHYIRKLKKVSLQTLGDALGMKTSTLHAYEKGSNFPNMVRIAALASYFHVSADWLMGIDIDDPVREICEKRGR